MTAIDRTAYPRPAARLTREELGVRYDLTEAEIDFVRANARTDLSRLLLAVLLKTRRDFGCFPAPRDIHAGIVAHVGAQLELTTPDVPTVELRHTSTLYRYHAAIRTRLRVVSYDDAAERLLSGTILVAAETMSDPADLINRAIEALQSAFIDLPAFSTLDRLAGRLRAEVHGRIFGRVAERLAGGDAMALDALLIRPPDSPTTLFNRLKQVPGPATPKTIRLWVERLEWLSGTVDPDPPLEGIAHTKLRQFAAEAAPMEVSDLLDIAHPGRRHTLLLAFLRQARMRCRDELVEMMLRRVRRTQALAKEQLEALHDQHRDIEEALIGVFGQVLETAQVQDTDAAFGSRVRALLLEQGGVDALAAQCETVSAWHRDNDLPLLWRVHARHRALLFRLIDLLDIGSATQDRSLLDAWTVVSAHRHARRPDVQADIDLGFASQRWRNFVVRRRPEVVIDRRALEVCVFIHLADALQIGDIYVVGAENFADYRAQLLPWSECEPRLPACCAALGIPERGKDFAAMLKAELAAAAAEVDAGLPSNTERINIALIIQHWEDLLRLAGSLKLGTVQAAGLIRTLQTKDRPSKLARALEELGRLIKTLYLLRFIDDEAYRRRILVQLNRGEGRHQLARIVFHGKRGELRQRYREGQEDQLGALGLVVNVIVLWNTIYMDATLNQLRAEGFDMRDEDVARLSPLGFDHINMLGRYAFILPDQIARGELRPLRDPQDTDDES